MGKRGRKCGVCGQYSTSVRKVKSMPVPACQSCRQTELPGFFRGAVQRYVEACFEHAKMEEIANASGAGESENRHLIRATRELRDETRGLVDASARLLRKCES